MQKMQAFNRERAPERVVHARWNAANTIPSVADAAAFMYPWAVVYQELGLEALVDMGVFLVILFLGLLYGWSKGAFTRQ